MRVGSWCAFLQSATIEITRNVLTGPYLRTTQMVIVSVSLSVLPLRGQLNLTASATPVQEIFPIPTPVGELGQRDATALAEIAGHLAAVGAVSWTGMQGTGTITFGPDQATNCDAALINLGSDRFRLDVCTSKGLTSERIHQSLGKIQAADGSKSLIPPDTALAGIFPFELLRMTLNVKTTSVFDHGLTKVNGTGLHRITVEVGSLGRNPLTKSQNTLAIDFYLDPATHLLTKTASWVTFAGGQRSKLLSVVTYEDYRRVDGVLIPFRFTEMLEGQQSQSLQLSDVHLKPSVDAAYFEFER